MSHRETHYRSILKALSWRVIGTILTLSIIFFFTREVEKSIESTTIIAIVSTVVYYFHERLWNETDWGRENV